MFRLIINCFYLPILFVIFMLSSCAEPEDKCKSQYCLNGGDCLYGDCKCPSGFTGGHCEIEKPSSSCDGVVCQNGGTCLTGSCNCPTGWTGAQCQIRDSSAFEKMPISYTHRRMGAQSNATGSFFSNKTGSVYGASDSTRFTTNAVDFSFAQTAPLPVQPEFISLSARRSEGLTRVITNPRVTNFKLTQYTKAAFDTINNQELKEVLEGNLRVIVIQPNKVYGFKNEDGKSGLIYIDYLDNGTGSNGSVIIDVKFERE